jgi:exodeoxyribonuclease VII small subunit
MKGIDELSFEAAFSELERAVQKLELGELTLEESVALFEQGQELAARCEEQLDSAELKIERLLTEARRAPTEV